MASDTLKVALLIVSTTAAKDPSTDASQQALREVLEGKKSGSGDKSRWELVDTKIVPDDTAEIRRQIILWADSVLLAGPGPDPSADHGTINLILTTGGTGFATADHTPEAVSAVLHRQAPGLVHAMLAASLAVTPFAMMSRPAAGVRARSVVLTLPGSPKGAVENLQAVLPTLSHACLQAAGLDSRSLHAGGVGKLEADAGIAPSSSSSSAKHSHSHSHDHGHTHGHSHSHSHGRNGSPRSPRSAPPPSVCRPLPRWCTRIRIRAPPRHSCRMRHRNRGRALAPRGISRRKRGRTRIHDNGRCVLAASGGRSGVCPPLL